eukprot:766894-Hanusia_phi.AAC.7
MGKGVSLQEEEEEVVVVVEEEENEVKRRLGPSPDIKFVPPAAAGEAQASSKEAEESGEGQQVDGEPKKGTASEEKRGDAGEGMDGTAAAEVKGGGGHEQETSQTMQEDVPQESEASNTQVKKEAGGGKASGGGEGEGGETLVEVKVKPEPGVEDAMDVDPQGDQ